jgi:hypothetical protein
VEAGHAAAPPGDLTAVVEEYHRALDTFTVVHRHADPITAARPADSVIQR